MRRLLYSATVAVILVLGGCGDSADEPESTAPPLTAAATTPTTTVATTPATPTTEAAPPATTAAPVDSDSGEDLEIVQVEELEYLVDDEETWTLDVFYPTEGGPWPLVVIFPGACDNCADTSSARIVAQGGAVVAAPRYWHGIGSSTPTEYLAGNTHGDRAACAVGYAQAIAGDYDGRADMTTVVGFSAGVHPAGWVGLGVANDEMCDEPIKHLPRGLVVGDGQFIFQDTAWDRAFQDEGATETVDRYLNPDRWNIVDDLMVHLWSTESTLTSTAIEDPPQADSWVWLRDTTGTLVDDLRAVGALDDGTVDFYDNALLLERRMLDRGIVVTTVRYPGDHRYNAEVYDRIMEVANGRSG